MPCCALSCAALLLAASIPAAQANWLSRLGRIGAEVGEVAPVPASWARQARRHRAGARRRSHPLPADRRQGRRARRACDAGRPLEVRQPRGRRLHRRHAGRVAARRADPAARRRPRRQPRHLPQRGHAVPRPRAAEGPAPGRQAVRRRRRRQLSAARPRRAPAPIRSMPPCAPTCSSTLRERALFDEAIAQLERPLSRSSIRTLALEPGGPGTLSSYPRLDPETKAALVDAIDPRVARRRAVLGARADGAGHRPRRGQPAPLPALERRRAERQAFRSDARCRRRRRQSRHPARRGAAPAGRAQLAVAAHCRRRPRRRAEAGDVRRFPRCARRARAASSMSACSARDRAASPSARCRRRQKASRSPASSATCGRAPSRRHRQRRDDRSGGARARRGAPEGARPPPHPQYSRRGISSPISSASSPACSAGRSPARGSRASGRRSSARSTASASAIAPRRACACWRIFLLFLPIAGIPALIVSFVQQLWALVTLPCARAALAVRTRARRSACRLMAGLAGKTLFITGASRGIGLAIALRAARDGANVAIVAKTEEPHPKLEGTIHTAAAEIERREARRCRSPATSASRSRSRAPSRDGRGLRRHRHLRQQRQRHLAHPDRKDDGEALRPDVRDQHARHLARHQGVPAAPAQGREPAHADAVAAARP